MKKFRPNSLKISHSLLKARYVKVKQYFPRKNQIQGPARKIWSQGEAEGMALKIL